MQLVIYGSGGKRQVPDLDNSDMSGLLFGSSRFSRISIVLSVLASHNCSEVF
jgi:hypothetical protein